MNSLLSTYKFVLLPAIFLIVFSLKREKVAIFCLFITLAVAATWYFPVKRIALLSRWGFIGVMLYHYFKNRAETRQTDLIDRLFIAFIMLCFFSATYSINRTLTLLRSLLLLFMYVVVFREMFRFLSQKDGIAAFRNIVTWYVRIVFLVNSLLFVSGNAFCYTLGRFRGFFENPNTLGLFGCIGLPIMFAAFAEGKDKPVIKRMFDGIFLVMAIGCMLLSSSRTGLIAALCGTFVYLMISVGLKKKYVILAAVAAIFVYAANIKILPMLEPLMRIDSISDLSGRTLAWQLAFDLIRERPFLGYGYGTEELVFLFSGADLTYVPGRAVHNSFIGIALMTGYLGFVIFAALLGMVGFYCSRLSSVSAKLGDFRPIAALSIGVVVAGLIAALAESWIVAIGGVASMLFWLFVVMVFLLDYHFVRGRAVIEDADSAAAALSQAEDSHTPNLKQPDLHHGKN